MKHSSKRILVTGSTGFLGTALRGALVAQGHTVFGTSTRGSRSGAGPCFQWDLREADTIQKILENAQPDKVIHLASPINLRRDPALRPLMHRCIVEGGKVLALACEAHGIPLIAAGTCEEYGAQEGPYTEVMQAPGVSPYSIAKAEFTKWAMDRFHTSTLQVTVVRPFLTYGPGQMSPRLIPSAIQAALSGQVFLTTEGHQTREFNYINDMTRGFEAVLRSDVSGEIINLGGGTEHSIREVVEQIFLLTEADLNRVTWGALPYREGEVQRFVGVHDKANRLLNFQAKTGLREGLRATIAWWRERVASED
ncbi:MAG: NAD(P)-dependent oxidoreductase [Myxococcota bacterium]|jgi:nucleoside-diphosphate-sugar epimerase|nr:NAD(P)-dependent oxidoreductase [Myxococcota bacterium]